jgi:tetratricopeptide (TPR) repeat protein
VKDHLIPLYQDAIASINVRNFEQARKLLNTMAIEQPNFEHGGVFYNLGCCLEELKEYGSARQAFEKAGTASADIAGTNRWSAASVGRPIRSKTVSAGSVQPR